MGFTQINHYQHIYYTNYLLKHLFNLSWIYKAITDMPLTSNAGVVNAGVVSIGIPIDRRTRGNAEIDYGDSNLCEFDKF